MVTDEVPIHIKYLYKPFNAVTFEKHLDFYVKHYKPVEHFSDFEKPGRFLLTFDDGLREVYDVVAPILKRKGIRAMIFVNLSFVGNSDLMFRYKASFLIDKLLKKQISPAESEQLNHIFEMNNLSVVDIKKSILEIDYSHRKIIEDILLIFDIDILEYLQKQKPYMSLEQIKQLESDGFWIGMHSATHPDFKQLAVDEQYSDIRSGVQWHKTHFPDQPSYFAFPFTDDGLLLKSIKLLNSLGVTKSFGTAGIKLDVCRNHFQRFPVENYSGNINSIIRGELVYQLLLRIFGKHKVIHR